MGPATSVDWAIRFVAHHSHCIVLRRPLIAPLQEKPKTMPFYAVAKGHSPGVYTSWDDAKKQVERFPNARHKKFAKQKDALSFVAENECTTSGQASGSGVPLQQPASGQPKFKESSNFEEEQEFFEQHRRMQDGDASGPHPMNPSTLVAFTDGSALGNGTPNVSAGWACVFPHNSDWNRSEALAGLPQTNNRAEYRAAIEAILRANVEDPAKVKPLYIYSDSMLLIRSMTEWISRWRARGWIRADGAPVRNIDMLKCLQEEQGERHIIWRHVQAHTNQRTWKSEWNNLADRMARAQANIRNVRCARCGAVC